MSDPDDESTTVWWRSSTVQVVLMSLLVVPLGVLLVVPALGSEGSGLATATVGLVLAEALVLHVGYGALTRIVSPAFREILVSI